MRKFPGYDWEKLKRLKAHLFFTMLRHSFRFDAADARQAITIASITEMDQSDREQTIDYYSNASRDILEDVEGLTDSGDYSAIEQLKKAL